jgi:V8-like Glu-specific endopeptidase
MFKIFLCTTIIAITSTNWAFALNKVVYGDDNRRNVHEHENRQLRKMALSTAAQIDKRKFEVITDDLFKVSGSLMVDKNLCEDEAFSNQLSTSDCSGFLVGKDLLVTAGHCAKNQKLCDGKNWVFDYRSDLSHEGLPYAFIPSENVYSCAEIINQTLDYKIQNDFALIRLDREVTGREPLKYRKKGKVDLHADVAVIGYPSGLQLIIADNAIVRKNDHPFFFETNTDSFGGSSGSPVINVETGLVEGILARGEYDYSWDKELNCKRPYKCTMEDCRGEHVTRISVISELVGEENIPTTDDLPYAKPQNTNPSAPGYVGSL